MRVNGIIAEYNPFHNGHKYHLEESLRRTGANYTIVVMSGNFVQRGEPALLSKHARAEMALCGGADLVLELPTLCAASSSEYFAEGAAALLDRLGVVTHLCFGSECGDVTVLKNAAELLSKEPAAYRLALKQGLKQGMTYPQARAYGMEVYGREQSNLPPAWNAQNLSHILSCPNNILGTDYIRALSRRGSAIQPVTIQRLGAGYNDLSLPSSSRQPACPEKKPAPVSALAIRRVLLEEKDPGQIAPYMPPEALLLLKHELTRQKALCADSFSSVLHYKLLLEQKDGFEKYLDVSWDLSNRIVNHLGAFTGFTAFCGLLKTKNMTYARISRCLLHILLNLEQKDMESAKAMDYVPYARVLGFRKTAAPLLSSIRSNSSIPLVTKLADAQKLLPPKAFQLLQKDLLATEIYHMKAGASVPNEAARPLLIL